MKRWAMFGGVVTVLNEDEMQIMHATGMDTSFCKKWKREVTL